MQTDSHYRHFARDVFAKHFRDVKYQGSFRLVGNKSTTSVSETIDDCSNYSHITVDITVVCYSHLCWNTLPAPKRPYVEVRLVFLSITTHYLSYSFNLFIWQRSCWYVFRNRAICNEWLKSKFQLQILGRSACYVLTLASTGHFASFHGPREGGGGVRPHRAVSSLIELELREKKRACSSPRDDAIGI